MLKYKRKYGPYCRLSWSLSRRCPTGIFSAPRTWPEVHSPVDSDEADPRPEAEDGEFFKAPDTQSKEGAINKFLDGIEGQECSGFKDIH